MFDLKNIVIAGWSWKEQEQLASCFKVFMDGEAVCPTVLLYTRLGGYVELRWQRDPSQLDKLHSKIKQMLGEMGVKWGEWTAIKRDGPLAGTVFACVEVEVLPDFEDKKEKTCCEEAAQKGQPFCDCEIPF